MKRPIYNLPLKDRRKIAKGIDEENKSYGKEFKELHKMPLANLFDRNGTRQLLLRSYRNHRFVVQIYDQGNWLRISVNRAKYDPEKNLWAEGITWDELMEIKRSVGFADQDAIEIYPCDEDIVDVSNMRHIFVPKNDLLLDCIWRTAKKESL